MRTTAALGLLVVLASCAAVCGGIDPGGLAAPRNSGNLLRLKVGSFDPAAQQPTVPTGLSGVVSPASEDYYIVQFSGTVRPEWRAEVEALGGTLYGYVPTHAYLVKLAKPLVQQIRQLPQVRWVGFYEPGYRVSPDLFEDLGSSAEISVVVSTFEADELPAVLAVVSAERGRLLDVGEPKGSSARAVLKGRSIARLAQATGVSWVEEFLPHQLFNDVSTVLIGAQDVWSVPGVSGAGQIVAVADTGLDIGVTDSTVHPDFYGRIVEGQAWGRPTWDDPHGHGTHVSGSVLGDGTQSSGLYAGVAPSAELIMQSVLDDYGGLGGLPADLRELFAGAYDAGARIHSDSWGADSNGAYTTDSWNVDRFAWDHKDIAILFAAGNAGVDLNKDGVVDASSVGAPGTAKNCITVGASENDRPTINSYIYGSTYYGGPISGDYLADDPGGLAAFSSRGPTGDGRLKPDLVAPGTFVCSARTRQRAVDADFDGGSLPSGWSADAGWTITSVDSHSGSYALAQGTPSTSYLNNVNSWIDVPAVDISDYDHDWLYIGLWMRYNIENNKDVAYVLMEDESNPGNWYYVPGYSDFTGATTGWTLKLVPVDPSLAYETLHLAIALLTDGSNAPAGAPYYVLIDDVRVFSLSGWRPAELGLSTDGSVVDDSYQLMCGTSMATPLTAGAVALLREHLVSDTGIADPSAALLKATLIATADDLTPGQYGTGSTQEIQGRPDRSQGWGRVNVKSAIAPEPPAAVVSFDVGTGLAQDATSSLSIEVTDGSVPLRVALVWTDPAPAAPSVTPQLVNDLDLTVTDPSAVDHVAMGGSGDHLNNVELVEIAAPELGTYAITVEGHDVNGPDQPFAVVAYGAAQEAGLAPEVSAAEPVSGSQGVMSLDVAITGLHTHFVDGLSQASLSGTGIRVNSTSVVDATHAVASINIDLSAPLGSRDITVTTGDETATGVDLFAVTLSTLSVSVAPSGWEIGAVGPGAVLTTWTASTPALAGHFQVRNDGSSAASLMLGAAESEGWTPGTSPGTDQFVVGWGRTTVQGTEPSYTAVSIGGVSLVNDLPASGVFAFDLQCLAPTGSTDPSEQHLTVIIGAQP